MLSPKLGINAVMQRCLTYPVSQCLEERYDVLRFFYKTMAVGSKLKSLQNVSHSIRLRTALTTLQPHLRLSFYRTDKLLSAAFLTKRKIIAAMHKILYNTVLPVQKNCQQDTLLKTNQLIVWSIE